jgi:hypothetical protein
VDLSTNYSTIGVGMRSISYNNFMVSLVIKLIYAPKSIKIFLMRVSFILTSTIGLLGFSYLGTVMFLNIMSASCPKTCIV